MIAWLASINKMRRWDYSGHLIAKASAWLGRTCFRNRNWDLLSCGYDQLLIDPQPNAVIGIIRYIGSKAMVESQIKQILCFLEG